MFKFEFSRKTRNIFRIILLVFVALVAMFLAGLITQLIMLVFNGIKLTV